jgi:hypothetical protein
MAEAEARDRTKKRLAEEEKLQKVEMTKLKAANALYNKKLKGSPKHHCTYPNFPNG